MSVLRVKPLDAILKESEGTGEHALKRVLGAGDLIMLAIGAVIGAGIFGAIGTAAAGQIGPNGEVIRYGAGPALIFSFILLGGACALAALCYAELAAMIPQAGSAYAYSYATLGELVAWIIGWDLILEYAVGNVAVAISWGDYVKTLLPAPACICPTGSRPDIAPRCSVPIRRCMVCWPRRRSRSASVLINFPAFFIVMFITWLLLRGARESARANMIMVIIKLAALALFCGVGLTHMHPGELHAVRAEWLQRHPPGRGDRVLCLHRLRCDFDGGRRNQEPATEPPDRHSWRAGDLYGHLCACRIRPRRHGAHQGTRRRRSARARVDARRLLRRSAGSWRSAPPCRCRPCCWCSSTASRASSSRWRVTACSRSGPRAWTRRRAFRHVTTIVTGVIVALASAVGDAAETYDLTNIGTLFAFVLVCGGVMMLRIKDPKRHRPFRVPLVWVVAPAGMAACVFVMYGLPPQAWERFGIWLVIGLVLYFSYGYWRSRLRA